MLLVHFGSYIYEIDLYTYLFCQVKAFNEKQLEDSLTSRGKLGFISGNTLGVVSR